ncbi:MAG: hypothetical protein QM757_24720, partial [Paludibaculum sp.]
YSMEWVRSFFSRMSTAVRACCKAAAWRPVLPPESGRVDCAPASALPGWIFGIRVLGLDGLPAQGFGAFEIAVQVGCRGESNFDPARGGAIRFQLSVALGGQLPGETNRLAVLAGFDIETDEVGLGLAVAG